MVILNLKMKEMCNLNTKKYFKIRMNDLFPLDLKHQIKT